jgi:PPOX class probable F420-dependent enzyme
MHHRAMTATTLTPDEVRFLAEARTATLATARPDGGARLVPICFVAVDGTPCLVYTPIDEKPKQTDDPRALARVGDIAADSRVSLLVDRWSEDWLKLGWLRLDGTASLLEPGAADVGAEHASAVVALRAKYPQYAAHRLEERPIIRIVVERASSWGDLSG